MFCPNCGHAADGNFCTSCGTRLVSTPAPEKKAGPMSVLEAVKTAQKKEKVSSLFTKDIAYCQSMLSPGETVVYAMHFNISVKNVTGKLDPDLLSVKDKRAGILVVTARRIFFGTANTVNTLFKEIPLNQLRSMDEKTKMTVLGRVGCLRIVGLTDMLVVDGTQQELTGLKAAIAQARSMPAADPAPRSGCADDLRSLKQLYDEGVITAEEFAAKKAQSLGL